MESNSSAIAKTNSAYSVLELSTKELELVPVAMDAVNKAEDLVKSYEPSLPEWSKPLGADLSFPLCIGKREDHIIGVLGVSTVLLISSPASLLLALNSHITLMDTLFFALTGLCLGTIGLLYITGWMHSGEGTHKPQPIRKFLNRIFVSKKNRRLLAERSKEREVYYLAKEAQKILGERLLSELSEKGYSEIVTRKKSHDEEYIEDVYQIEYSDSSNKYSDSTFRNFTLKKVVHTVPISELPPLEPELKGIDMNRQTINDISSKLKDRSTKLLDL